MSHDKVNIFRLVALLLCMVFAYILGWLLKDQLTGSYMAITVFMSFAVLPYILSWGQKEER